MTGLPKLTEQDWQRLLNRLTVHAQRQYMRLGWFSNGRYRSPQGQGPEDVATEAITRTIEGRRTYDEKKCPDFYYFLKRCVDSIISHLIDSKEAEKIKSILQETFVQDEVVCGMLDCLDAGIDKPSEMAEYLEVGVKEVNNAQKRLRREVDKKLKKYK